MRRPGCQQCEKSGYSCAGYNDSTHFVIYRPAGAHLHSRSDDHRQPNVAISEENGLSLLPVSICRTAVANLHFGLAWRSLAGNDDSPTLLSWAPSMPSVQMNGTAPNMAFLSVALAMRGQELQDQELIMQSEVAYVKALSAVARLSLRGINAVINDALAAVLLLALYEVSFLVCFEWTGLT